MKWFNGFDKYIFEKIKRMERLKVEYNEIWCKEREKEVNERRLWREME